MSDEILTPDKTAETPETNEVLTPGKAAETPETNEVLTPDETAETPETNGIQETNGEPPRPADKTRLFIVGGCVIALAALIVFSGEIAKRLAPSAYLARSLSKTAAAFNDGVLGFPDVSPLLNGSNEISWSAGLKDYTSEYFDKDGVEAVKLLSLSGETKRDMETRRLQSRLTLKSSGADITSGEFYMSDGLDYVYWDGVTPKPVSVNPSSFLKDLARMEGVSEEELGATDINLVHDLVFSGAMPPTNFSPVMPKEDRDAVTDFLKKGKNTFYAGKQESGGAEYDVFEASYGEEFFNNIKEHYLNKAGGRFGKSEEFYKGIYEKYGLLAKASGRYEEWEKFKTDVIGGSAKIRFSVDKRGIVRDIFIESVPVKLSVSLNFMGAAHPNDITGVYFRYEPSGQEEKRADPEKNIKTASVYFQSDIEGSTADELHQSVAYRITDYTKAETREEAQRVTPVSGAFNVSWTPKADIPAFSADFSSNKKSEWSDYEEKLEARVEGELTAGDSEVSLKNALLTFKRDDGDPALTLRFGATVKSGAGEFAPKGDTTSAFELSLFDLMAMYSSIEELAGQYLPQ
ncbi:MAG: hypothetical protein LBU36_04115 [Clostridiales bacterium]|nr:hypothetical protein [Clostridiales bacterium]